MLLILGTILSSLNEDTETDPNTPARVEVRVGPGADEILDIDVTVANTLLYHHQRLNFSLVDGNNLDFVIEKLTMGAADAPDAPDVPVFDMAQIKKKSGVTLSSAQPYDFKLVVNEFGNAPNNSTEIPIRIVVVVDNVAPVFVANPESGTVAERARNWPIATFSASDTNNQVLRYGISAKPGDAGAARILVSLKMGEFDGELRTLTAAEVAKLTTALQKAQPDYIEPDEEDDETTPNVDETDPASKDNEHVFVVSVNDGTSYAYHEFTLTVTDEDDPAPGSGQKLSIDEDEGEGVDNTFGTAPVIPSEAGTYEVGQQIDNLGNIAGAQSGNVEDVLFDIDPQSGALYLLKKGTIDFESGIVTYTLSISKGAGRSAIVVVSVNDVNEGPKFSKDDHESYDDTNAASDDDEIVLYVLESAAVDEIVKIGKDAGGNPATTDAIFAATDEDTKASFRGTAYDFWYEGDTVDDDDNADNKLDDAYDASANALFYVDTDGSIKVKQVLDTDADDSLSSISLKLRAYDTTEVIPDAEEGDERSDELRRELKDVLPIRIEIIDTNVAPEFIAESRAQTHKAVSESADENYEIFEYIAEDEDGDTVKYRLRDQDDSAFFVVEERMVAHPDTTKGMVPGGVLKVGPPAVAGENTLDYEVNTSHTVEIQAYDTDGDTDEIVVEIEVINENDETPTFLHNPLSAISVVENTARGTKLGNSYEANDPDGFAITYSLTGDDAKSFQISDSGVLMTLESLDYDRPVPCGANTCNVIVNASDGAETLTMNVAITVTPSEDSVSTLNVTKANPVPGTTRGDPMTALGNTKASISDAVPERPADLPNKGGAPLNFVETDWASWGTVLRIEVTAQSPDATCGGGNECVVINLNSDSADDTLQVKAYRMDTPAGADIEREQVRCCGDAG